MQWGRQMYPACGGEGGRECYGWGEAGECVNVDVGAKQED